MGLQLDCDYGSKSHKPSYEHKNYLDVFAKHDWSAYNYFLLSEY